jgi:hypothetical protein
MIVIGAITAEQFDGHAIANSGKYRIAIDSIIGYDPSIAI